MLENKIRDLVVSKGNEIKFLKIDMDPDLNLAFYETRDGLDNNIWHQIYIQRCLTGEDESDAILHEYVHIYLRELGFDYSEALSIIKFDDEFFSVSSQLVNLFDHWILVKIISKYGRNNDFFIMTLENEIKGKISNQVYEKNIAICTALGLLDLSIHKPESFDLNDINALEVRKYYELILPLKEILIFVDNFDEENEEIRNDYLERLKTFTNELVSIVT